MSNHTKIWSDKKAELILREKELKEELESVSLIFEGKTKKLLIATGAIAVVGLIGYFGYKALSGEKKGKKPIKRIKKKVQKKAVIGTMITERLISSVLNYLSIQLDEIFKGNTKKN